MIELQKLFTDTIREICRTDYNERQIDAWCRGVENTERWQKMLETQFVVVAEEEKVIGFCSLDHGNHIDFLFIHKDYQRKGVAHQLYDEIEKEARRLQQVALTSDVSKTARPFFERIGFKVKKEQEVRIRDVVLTNYKMIKSIQ
ncbi:GNAT family N-acetyltransferase [Algivirga pacifica]|uniref:GNAT family N-acetyltransferase n=2 Tax=Algivirga pacifica TaxID=1162670 RepID=A0ABP9DIE9_9BACT